MRYSLLNFVVCPRCREDLASVTLSEASCPAGVAGLAPCSRVSAVGNPVGPLPAWTRQTASSTALAALSGPPAPPERNHEVVVQTGLLACGACGAWYPIIGCIPELLPDHLRDWARDREWLESVSSALPRSLLACWRDLRPADAPPDSGAHHKLAEISLPSKVTDPTFWGPGYVSPFNVWDPGHTWHLIRNFAIAEPLLELRRGDVVLDSGSGYSWTTEWLLRGGYEPIGMDICRAYLEIGLVRTGANRPHLLVGDVEHIPLRGDTMRAVLAFEAFHHVPDRAAAMREFARVLADGCPVVLVEPSSAHEHAAESRDVMRKYGILEKGMDLEDVEAYARGSGLGECRQHRMARSIAHRDSGASAQAEPVSLIANNVYTLRKGARPARSRWASLLDRLADRVRAHPRALSAARVLQRLLPGIRRAFESSRR